MSVDSFINNNNNDDDVGYEDMIYMPSMTENDILNNVTKRFFAGLPYTYVSDIVISVNPYRDLNLYDENHFKLFKAKLPHDTIEDVPKKENLPHLYSISKQVYEGMFGEYFSNQSVLISGESGSGKTESSKLLVSYLSRMSSLADISGNKNQIDIESKLLAAQPILESFGNAMTTLNNNSSRVGRWLTINFAETGQIHSAELVSYLLEISRVCAFGVGERNFHIFYQLCAASQYNSSDNNNNYGMLDPSHSLISLSSSTGSSTPTQNTLSSSVLSDVDSDSSVFSLAPYTTKDFQYLNDIEIDRTPVTSPKKGTKMGNAAPLFDDKIQTEDFNKFTETIESMNVLGFSSQQVTQIFQILKSILFIGNIAFYTKSGTTVRPDTEMFLKKASECLGVDTDSLVRCLTKRIFSSPSGTLLNLQLSVFEAEETRNTLAKALYGRLFAFIIDHINKHLLYHPTYETSNSGRSTPTREHHHRNKSALSEAIANSNSNNNNKKKNVDKKTTEEPNIHSWCGILDIFGFELTPNNSFEQLMINFANEKLQQFFIQKMFKLEQSLYRAEEIDFKAINFNDNHGCLQLFESKKPPIGILPIIDDQMKLLDKNDIHIYKKIHSTLVQSKFLDIPLNQDVTSDSDMLFTIRHYPEPVTYSSFGFLEKNSRKLRSDVIVLAGTSRDSLVRELFADADNLEYESSTSTNNTKSKKHGHKSNLPDNESKPISTADKVLAVKERLRKLREQMQTSNKTTENKTNNNDNNNNNNNNNNNKRKKKMFATITGQFQHDLSNLLLKLRASNSQFLRCIKPNRDKDPYYCDDSEVERQLRTSGMIAAVKIRAMGYDQRMSHAGFVKRFKAIFSSNNMLKGATSHLRTEQDKAEWILKIMTSRVHALKLTPYEKRVVCNWKIGKSMVFFHKDMLYFLKVARSEALKHHRQACIPIQALVRGYIYRKYWTPILWTWHLLCKETLQVYKDIINYHQKLFSERPKQGSTIVGIKTIKRFDSLINEMKDNLLLLPTKVKQQGIYFLGRPIFFDPQNIISSCEKERKYMLQLMTNLFCMENLVLCRQMPAQDTLIEKLSNDLDYNKKLITEYESTDQLSMTDFTRILKYTIQDAKNCNEVVLSPFRLTTSRLCSLLKSEKLDILSTETYKQLYKLTNIVVNVAEKLAGPLINFNRSAKKASEVSELINEWDENGLPNIVEIQKVKLSLQEYKRDNPEKFDNELKKRKSLRESHNSSDPNEIVLDVKPTTPNAIDAGHMISKKSSSSTIVNNNETEEMSVISNELSKNIQNVLNSIDKILLSLEEKRQDIISKNDFTQKYEKLEYDFEKIDNQVNNIMKELENGNMIYYLNSIDTNQLIWSNISLLYYKYCEFKSFLDCKDKTQKLVSHTLNDANSILFNNQDHNNDNDKDNNKMENLKILWNDIEECIWNCYYYFHEENRLKTLEQTREHIAQKLYENKNDIPKLQKHVGLHIFETAERKYHEIIKNKWVQWINDDMTTLNRAINKNHSKIDIRNSLNRAIMLYISLSYNDGFIKNNIESLEKQLNDHINNTELILGGQNVILSNSDSSLASNKSLQTRKKLQRTKSGHSVLENITSLNSRFDILSDMSENVVIQPSSNNNDTSKINERNKLLQKMGASLDRRAGRKSIANSDKSRRVSHFAPASVDALSLLKKRKSSSKKNRRHTTFSQTFSAERLNELKQEGLHQISSDDSLISDPIHRRGYSAPQSVDSLNNLIKSRSNKIKQKIQSIDELHNKMIDDEHKDDDDENWDIDDVSIDETKIVHADDMTEEVAKLDVSSSNMKLDNTDDDDEEEDWDEEFADEVNAAHGIDIDNTGGVTSTSEKIGLNSNDIRSLAIEADGFLEDSGDDEDVDDNDGNNNKNIIDQIDPKLVAMTLGDHGQNKISSSKRSSVRRSLSIKERMQLKLEEAIVLERERKEQQVARAQALDDLRKLQCPMPSLAHIQPVKVGYLLKQGSTGVTTWKRRLFMLEGE